MDATGHRRRRLASRERAAQRERDGLRRTLGRRVRADDALLDLASNDYLGLARGPASGRGAPSRRHAPGEPASTGSRLVTGTTDLHAELEQALASLRRAPCRAGLLASGYAANLGAVVALSGPGALVVSDADNHASLVDACRLSRRAGRRRPRTATSTPSPLRWPRGPRRARSSSPTGCSRWTASAPGRDAARRLRRRRRRARRRRGARRSGVLGPGGPASAPTTGVAAHPSLVRTVTLSKSLGAQGGAVLGSAGRGRPPGRRRAAVHVRHRRSRPPAAGAALAALRVLRGRTRAAGPRACRSRASCTSACAAPASTAVAPSAAVVAGAASAPRTRRSRPPRRPLQAGVRVGLLPAALGARRGLPAAAHGPRPLSADDLDRAAVALAAAAQACAGVSTAART